MVLFKFNLFTKNRIQAFETLVASASITLLYVQFTTLIGFYIEQNHDNIAPIKKAFWDFEDLSGWEK
jgi:hypothetical protein